MLKEATSCKPITTLLMPIILSIEKFRMYHDNDQRFFPFLLPLLAGGIVGGIAGAAISPWLFNRPFYQPYPYPYPYPVPYPTHIQHRTLSHPTPYPASPGYAGNPAFPQPYAAPVPIIAKSISCNTGIMPISTILFIRSNE